jgi:hypothetical protein
MNPNEGIFDIVPGCGIFMLRSMTVVHVENNDRVTAIHPRDNNSGADRIFGGEGAKEITSTVEMNVHRKFLRLWDSRWAICPRF